MPIKVSITTKRSGPPLTQAVAWPIACPKCGHETEQSIAALKTDPTLVCPSCSEAFKIESQDTAKQTFDQIAEIDRLMDTFGKR